MTNLPFWGGELRKQRKAAGLTQGQLIDQLSHLISDLSDEEKIALESIEVYNEAATYFGGILDSPTLSRLEKGTRTLAQRPRVLAFVWGLRKLGGIQTMEQANHFLEIGNHGNLTPAEADALFGIPSGSGGVDAVTNGAAANDAEDTSTVSASTVSASTVSASTVSANAVSATAASTSTVSTNAAAVDSSASFMPEQPEHEAVPTASAQKDMPKADPEPKTSHKGLLVAAALLAIMVTVGFLMYQRAGTNSSPDQGASHADNQPNVRNNAAAQGESTVDTPNTEHQSNQSASSASTANIASIAPSSPDSNPSAITEGIERTSTTLSPNSMKTQLGSLGGDQVVAHLHMLDQSGTDDTWPNYIKFIPAEEPYRGFRSYFLPTYVEPSTVTALRLETNYRGPGAESQLWTWSLYNWSSQSWMPIGDNSEAPWWGEWTLLTFAAPGALADYIHPTTLEMQVQSVANNTVDSMDLDYEALTVEFPKSMAGTKIRMPAALSENFLGVEINPKLWDSDNAPSATIENNQLVFDTPINNTEEWYSESLEYLGDISEIAQVAFQITVDAPASGQDDLSASAIETQMSESAGSFGIATGCKDDQGWMTVFAGESPPRLFIEYAEDDQTESGEMVDLISIESGQTYAVTVSWLDGVVYVSIDGNAPKQAGIPCNATEYFNISTSAALGQKVSGSISSINVWH